MKSLVPLLIVFGVLVAFVLDHLDFGRGDGASAGRVPAYSWAEMRDIGEQVERTEARVRGVFRFHDRLEIVKGGLRVGTVSLAEAADTLHAAALRDNPAFLKSLERGTPDSPLREKLALVLLGHLREELRSTMAPHVADVVVRLDSELSAWTGVSPATLDALCEDGDSISPQTASELR